MKNKAIKLLIWGCGGHYCRMLPHLQEREKNGEITIVGVTDRCRPGDGIPGGYPYIPPEEVPKHDFDYLQILSPKNKPAIREAYLNMPGSDPKKILGQMYPEISIPQYFQLTAARPTIFSDSCWGGFVYYYLGMECLSPFKNLWLYDEDFLSFLHDPRGYMAEDPVPDHMQKAKTKWDLEEYPVLRLGDIYLHCNHSESMEQAIADWMRRREKINWNFTLAVMSASEREIEHEFNRLDTVHRKLCIVQHQTSEPCSYTLIHEPDRNRYTNLGEIFNHTAAPFHNPFDIYSLFFGELRENPCFIPDLPAEF